MMKGEKYIGYGIIAVVVLAVLFFVWTNPLVVQKDRNFDGYSRIIFPCYDDVRVLDEQENEYEVICDDRLTYIKIPSERDKTYFVYYDIYRKDSISMIKNKTGNITFIIKNENLIKYEY